MAVAAAGLLPKGARGETPASYAVVYAVKILLVTAVAWISRAAWRDLRPWPGPGWIAVSVVAGLAVTAVWIGLDGRVPPLPSQKTRSAFDPNQLSPGARGLFLAARFYGLVVVVPLIEELF